MTVLEELELVKHLDNMVTNILHDHNKYFEEYYINEQAFRRRIGLGVTKFYEWKKAGRFEKAMHPATRGSKRVFYHKYFNVYRNQIELPELRRLPIEPKHRRNKNGKKAANPQSSPKQESRQRIQEGGGTSENANQGFG